jgi:hydroxymethylglutaryl-CoA reductase (NADPH)
MEGMSKPSNSHKSPKSLRSFALDYPEDGLAEMHARSEYLSEISKVDLSGLATSESLDPNRLRDKNIENIIGRVEIPVGVAGPLLIKHEDQGLGEFYVPIATTEGALVASISRGCKLITAAGGASVSSIYHGMSRSLLFNVADIKTQRQFLDWVGKPEVKAKLEELAETTSGHIKLEDFASFNLGREVWLRMRFLTGEAMGMNMATVASEVIAHWLLQNFPGKLRLISLSGNLCSDKKPSSLNNLMGRGFSVFAEVEIPLKVLESLLKVRVEDMLEVVETKTLVGSNLAGSLGQNAHAANVIAGVFAATGQDIAHTVDATASTFFRMKRISKDEVLATVDIKSLPVGTVGGGTHLPQQAKALELFLTDISGNLVNKLRDSQQKMAPYMPLRAKLFAQNLAVAVLAGEINLHAALANNTLAAAHAKLGKGRN